MGSSSSHVKKVQQSLKQIVPVVEKPEITNIIEKPAPLVNQNQEQNEIVSLFGTVYKYHGSTGSLEDLGKDKKINLFVVGMEPPVSESNETISSNNCLNEKLDVNGYDDSDVEIELIGIPPKKLREVFQQYGSFSLPIAEDPIIHSVPFKTYDKLQFEFAPDIESTKISVYSDSSPIEDKVIKKSLTVKDLVEHKIEMIGKTIKRHNTERKARNMQSPLH